MRCMMKLQNRIALVTGSTQGIGRGIAVRLAEAGADLVINGREDGEEAQETLEQVRKLGRRACFIAANVGVVNECRRLVSEAVAQMGPLDILVNNAGLQKHCPFLDAEEAEYDQVLEVNLRGPFFLAQAFARHLRDSNRGGKVINISSVHEELPFPNFTSYCVSKGGLKMMMRNLAVELAPLGININNIAPGAIATPMNANLLNNPVQLNALLKNIPLGRMGKPEDVAGLAAFLASADADYITGSTFYVDGGLLWYYTEQ